jgi:hypothetical protein
MPYFDETAEERAIAVEAEVRVEIEQLARAMCRTQRWCDGTCDDVEGVFAIHGADADALRAALEAERERITAILSADDLWLGVELLGINGVTFSEPMVSASGARAAVRAIVEGEP